MSTIHANTPLDCLYRLETCALLSGIEIPLTALRSQVASAIDAVVHTARLSDGSRKVIAISEVLPLKNGEYQTRDLIAWKTESVDAEGKIHGRFVLKEKPTFAEQAAMLGIQLPAF
jgi:pilus assembly protein CpaF